MGRGTSKAGRGNTARSEEDSLQFNEAVFFARTRGAGAVEYTDSKGKVRKQTIRQEGGIYKVKYNPEVEKYSKMSVDKLENELKKQQAISDKNYMLFTRSAASKSSSQVDAFTDADIKIKAIKQALRRKKKK